MPIDTRQLRQLINILSHEDFYVLVFDLFPEIRKDVNTPGLLHSRRVQLVIEHCDANPHQYPRLLDALAQERPNHTPTINTLRAQLPTQPTNQPTIQLSNQQTLHPNPNAPKRNPNKIFISHASADADLAHRLADDLEGEGFPVWIAPDSIHSGEQWVEAISRGLEECGIFLLLLSPEAVASKWVQRETNVAIELEHEDEVRLLPLHIRPCRLPPLWRSYQRIPWRGGYEAGWQKVLHALTNQPPNQLSNQPTIQPKKRSPITITNDEHEPLERSGEEVVATAQRKTVNEKGYEEWVHEKTGITMIRIPAGPFLYGDEKKEVDLSEFSIGKTPVTNIQYARFVLDTGREPPEHWKNAKPSVGLREKIAAVVGYPLPKQWEDNVPPLELVEHPVVYVSWHDATAFAEWAGLALPHEQQWEKAARGTDGREFPWGDEWRTNHCNTREAGIGHTTPAGQFTPRGDAPYGCIDMSGNVWEWCENLHRQSSDRRVVRGGSWDFSQTFARAAYRGFNDPASRLNYFGFRLVVRPPS